MRSSVIFLVLLLIMWSSAQWLPIDPHGNDVCRDEGQATSCAYWKSHCGNTTDVQMLCRRTCGLCLPSRRQVMQENIWPPFGMVPEDMKDEMTFNPQPHSLNIFKGHHMVEGDILLPDGVMPENVLNEITYDPQHRTLVTGNILWPENSDGWPEMPYRFLRKDSWNHTRRVIQAITHYELNTCIKFKEVAGNFAGDHVKFAGFQFQGKKCWSEGVGRMSYTEKNRGQRVAVAETCSLGTVIHEIGHALGFPHEHSRSDRDKVIKLLWDNIRNNSYTKNNFKTFETYNDVPYDLSSIMHYGQHSRSKKNWYAFVTVDPYDIRHIRVDQIPGRDRLSFRDIKNANIGYKCIDKWKAKFPNSPTCENEGFIGSEGKCICHSGTQGDRCQHKLRPNYYPDLTCGGNVTKRMILQPNPTTDGKKTERCMWWIQAAECRKAELTVLAFNMKPPCNKYTNFFEIRRIDPVLPGRQHCTDVEIGARILSKNQDVFIDYRGRPAFSNFRIRVDFVEDPGCVDLEHYGCSKCIDKDRQCKARAARGGCQKVLGGVDPDIMKAKCPKSCNPSCGVELMKGRKACAFRHLEVCAEKNRIFEVNPGTASQATICTKKRNFEDCMETESNRTPCTPINGDMYFLCNRIRAVVNGATGRSCLYFGN